MQIIRRSLFDSACKIGTATVYDSASPEHNSLLSSGLALLDPLLSDVQKDDHVRRLIVLSPKGEEVIRMEKE